MQEQWLEDLPIARVERLEPIHSGISNQVYKLTAAGRSYVLKHQRFSQNYDLNRAQEIRLQRQLADYGLAPEILYYDELRGLVLQPFIELPQLAHTELSRIDKIDTSAKVSARIHDLKITLPDWSLEQRIDLYLRQIKVLDAMAANYYQKRLAPYRRLLQQPSEAAAFCHNDLAFNHIFVDANATSIQVIDWEYAGVGDRYFDFANTILLNQFTAAESDHFCRSYQAHSGIRIDRERLNPMLELTDLVHQLWFTLHHQLQDSMND